MVKGTFFTIQLWTLAVFIVNPAGNFIANLAAYVCMYLYWQPVPNFV